MRTAVGILAAHHLSFSTLRSITPITDSSSPNDNRVPAVLNPDSPMSALIVVVHD
jgi:hypothetical protein